MLIALLLLLLPLTSAGPATGLAGSSIPLTRRKPVAGNRVEWLRAQADSLVSKYGVQSPSNTKRANTGTLPLTNQNGDITYYGTVSVGTPAQNFDIIMDTGSSDLWIASNNCQTGCEDITNTFDSSKSSTFKDANEPISIRYAGGEVAGELGTDTVTMAGFTVPNQKFGIMNQITAQLLSGSLTGIMGLGWPSIAASRATPWWESLVKSGAWAQPVLGFYLTRYIGHESSSETDPGGSMDIGFLNSSFTNINYIGLTSQTYWNIPLQTITVGKTQIQSGAGAAIDTGTTLIGASSSIVEAFYSHVPGATPGTGQLARYYEYSCSQAPLVSLTFGGRSYAIDISDFSLSVDTNGQTCVGALFSLDLGSGSGVEWVVGDTFLKNVYSVFRYSPPAVGFQALASSSVPPTSSSGTSTSPSSTVLSTTSSANSSTSSTTGSFTTTTTTTTSTSTTSILPVEPTSTFTVFVPPSQPETTTGAGTTTSTGAAIRSSANIFSLFISFAALMAISHFS